MSRRKQRAMRGPPPALANALEAIGPEPGYDGVHTVEDAATVAKARVAWQEKRRATVEAHRKRSRVTDVEAMQERHSPTVEIAVDDGDGKRRTRSNYTRVRQSEAWRHNRLSAMERQAELEMLRAWEARTGGGGAIRSALRPRLASGGYRESVENATLESAWLDVTREARRWKIKMAVVITVLTEPRTLAEVDRQYRLKSGGAFELYASALALWCIARGWVRPSSTNRACG